MAHKRVMFRSAAREKILRGATQLADAIRVTLGPKSKSVLIQRKWGAPIVCNDGVTIAKEFDLTDGEENLGAQVLRQAAEKTGEIVGDGTSTSTLLAHAIFADGVRNVVAGASAIDLKRGLDRGVKAAIDALKIMSRPVKTRKEKAQVGTISAHNDETVGELVADAMEKVGGDGVITVEESKTTETILDLVEGMQFDRGFVSPYFVTDAERVEAVLEDPYILLSDKKLGIMRDMLPLARTDGKIGSSAPRDRGRCGGRGFGNVDRQPDPRRLEGVCRQGARIWRPAQGHLGGHRDSDRRAGGVRGAWFEARDRDDRAARTRQARRRRQGRHDHHRRSGNSLGHRRPHPADSARDGQDHE